MKPSFGKDKEVDDRSHRTPPTGSAWMLRRAIEIVQGGGPIKIFRAQIDMPPGVDVQNKTSSVVYNGAF